MRLINKNSVSRAKRWQPRLEALESRRLLSVYADFNGDGRDDLAIGVPDEDSQSGRVHVLYGTASGLSSTNNQLWSQDSVDGVLQMPDTAEAGDQFGAALAGGDFNGDGFADLAIGVPGENLGPFDAGAVNILYGTASGLGISLKNNKLWHQDVNRVREVAENFDHFGSALTSGDFNGDGLFDLAVGVSGEDVGSVFDAGAVHIFYGTSVGINAPGNQLFSLESPGVPGVAGVDDDFSHSLASGDFNGDGRDDLAIGIEQFDTSGVENSGAVCVMYGSATGLVTAGSQLWNQDSSGIAGGAEEFDHFGSAVAAGDFNGDGRDDLAIGVEFEDLGFLGDHAGLVHVLYGSAVGITATGSDVLDQGSAGGVVESNDNFGHALTAADFNGDGRDDLAIGAPVERVGLGFAEGAVNVVFGSSSGISSATGIEITQEDIGTGDQSEQDDLFGNVLSAGDFNGNGRADLVMAAPHESIGTVEDAGRVFVLYGTASSNFTGGQAWDQDSPGIPNSPAEFDHFGGGLDAGGGKSAPGGGSGRRDLAQLISADFDLESLLTKPNKRRLLNGRR